MTTPHGSDPPWESRRGLLVVDFFLSQHHHHNGSSPHADPPTESLERTNLGQPDTKPTLNIVESFQRARPRRSSTDETPGPADFFGVRVHQAKKIEDIRWQSRSVTRSLTLRRSKI